MQRGKKYKHGRSKVKALWEGGKKTGSKVFRSFTAEKVIKQKVKENLIEVDLFKV